MNIAIAALFAVAILLLLLKAKKSPEDPGGLSEERVRELIAAKRKIEAIKVLRALRKTGLKEAKDQVEAIEEEMEKEARNAAASGSKLKEKADLKERL